MNPIDPIEVFLLFVVTCGACLWAAFSHFKMARMEDREDDLRERLEAAKKIEVAHRKLCEELDLEEPFGFGSDRDRDIAKQLDAKPDAGGKAER